MLKKFACEIAFNIHEDSTLFHGTLKRIFLLSSACHHHVSNHPQIYWALKPGFHTDSILLLCVPFGEKTQPPYRTPDLGWGGEEKGMVYLGPGGLVLHSGLLTGRISIHLEVNVILWIWWLLPKLNVILWGLQGDSVWVRIYGRLRKAGRGTCLRAGTIQQWQQIDGGPLLVLRKKTERNMLQWRGSGNNDDPGAIALLISRCLWHILFWWLNQDSLVCTLTLPE